MNRTILAAALALSSPAFAFNPLPTGLLVRVGADLNYYGGCSMSINALEPGSAGTSVLNVPSCQTYWHTTTLAPPWTLVPNVVYGDVYLPDRHLFDCSLIHSQLIVAGGSATQTITIECPAVPTASRPMP